ncbi:MAG TPA: DNA topoisomerase IB, partial [Chitinophagaceae bacterium]
MENPIELNIPKRKLKGLLRNAEKSAKIINLVYVSDKMAGIRREKKGNKFFYFKARKRITNDKDLSRIRKLVIPPAWTNVWICNLRNGHLQATGFDVRG